MGNHHHLEEGLDVEVCEVSQNVVVAMFGVQRALYHNLAKLKLRRQAKGCRLTMPDITPPSTPVGITGVLPKGA